MKKSNKILAGVIAGLVLTLGGVGAAACTSKNQEKSSAFNNAFNYSAIGGIELLKGVEQINKINLSATESRAISALNDSLTTITDEEKDLLLNNLLIAQNTLNGGVVKSEVKTSDREGYQFKYNLSAPSITGEYNIYTFYYNTTPEKDLDDIGEYEEYINGIVLLDGVEYSVKGEREVEGSEEEVSFLIKLSDSDYVEIERESERNEEEYSYTVISNGKKVFETEVEYEVKKNAKTELKFETKQNGIKVKYVYEFSENTKGKFVKVKLIDGQSEIKAIIQILTDENGNPVYEFVSSESQTKNVSANLYA